MRLVVVTVVGLLLALVNVSPALAQPANDDFDNATVVGALPFTDTIGTADATTADDDPFCNGNEHSVWYAFTPTANTTIRADTVGSDYGGGASPEGQQDLGDPGEQGSVHPVSDHHDRMERDDHRRQRALQEGHSGGVRDRTRVRPGRV